MNRMTRSLIAAAVLSAAADSLLAADSVETFTMAVSGQSSYFTYGQPEGPRTLFQMGPGIPSTAYSDPTQLAAANIAGTWRRNSSAGNVVLSDTTNVTGSGLSSFGGWTFSGSTGASARPGQLKAWATATKTGVTDSSTISSAESYGYFQEGISPTIPGVPNGTAATMRIAMSIDGALNVTGTGTAGMVFRYDYGDPRPGYPAVNRTLLESFADIYGNGSQVYGPHSYLGSFVTPAGFSLTSGPVNANNQPSFINFGGSSVVYADIPVTVGSLAEFRMGLLSWVDGGLAGTMDSQFGNTATMTGIQLFVGGTEYTNFSLLSESGATYTAAGVVIPEPAALAVLPITGLLLVRRMRRV